MNLALVANADATIDVAGDAVRVPVFPVSEVVAWCGEIDQRRREEFDARAKREIPDDERRVHYLTAYKPFDADEADVQHLAAHTPAGTLRVAAYCLSRATVTARGGVPLPAPEPLPADRAAAVVDANGVRGLRPLVRLLVGLPANPPPATAATKDEAGADPLPPSTSGPPTTPPTESGGSGGTGQRS